MSLPSTQSLNFGYNAGMKPINWWALIVGGAILWVLAPSPVVFGVFFPIFAIGYVREVNGKRSI